MVNRSGNRWLFQLIRPGARQVFVVGDFNGWSTAATPMQRNDAGLWQCEMLLPPGVYRFRYCADDQWLTDYAAYGVQRNTLGDFDSVLLVTPPPMEVSKPLEIRINHAATMPAPFVSRRKFRHHQPSHASPAAMAGA